MTRAEQFQSVIDHLTAVRETRAVNQKGGKRYTMVADRVEAFRRQFADEFSIQTEIIQYGLKNGEPIVIKATISRAGNDVIVATGFAEGIRGLGHINKTSALENCETSAIGRALANLGFHGGEFASDNELDIARDKEDAQSEQVPQSENPADSVHTKPKSAAQAKRDGDWEQFLSRLGHCRTDEDFQSLQDDVATGSMPQKFKLAAFEQIEQHVEKRRVQRGFLERLDEANDDPALNALQDHVNTCDGTPAFKTWAHRKIVEKIDFLASRAAAE